MSKVTPQEWDEIRKKFHQSIMVDTSLSSLAQNLDTKDWPNKGDDETPAKYIDFNYDELLMLPEIAGSEERAGHLASILKETLAFDDPFGDMVAQVEETAARENPILKTLARLEIPEAYPLALVNLSEGTRAVCVSEGVKTLGEFANLAQQMSTRVVIGGDFRALLNALTHGDEDGIGQFLPYRRGTSGLHLPEAIGLVVARLARPDQLALGLSLGASLVAAERGQIQPASAAAQERLLQSLQVPLNATLEWFKAEKEALAAQVAGGTALARVLVVIGDPAREAIAVRLLTQAIPSLVATQPAVKSGGFFSRLFGRG